MAVHCAGLWEEEEEEGGGGEVRVTAAQLGQVRK